MTDMLAANQSAIDEFCDTLWLEDGLAKNSLDAYRRDMTSFANWLQGERGKDLHAVQAVDIQAYFAARHGETKATSANRRLAVLKRFYQLALRQNKISTDPCLKMRSAKQPPRYPKTLSETQVEALLAAPDVNTPLGLRDRTMLEL
ncbi:MAG TPA: site-specific integrase, partial [Noviherbaspirillum sp.]|nr:site-specific integrase [Noviherbaspirillum sp.]